MGAVARGAACFAGGLEIFDFIQHEYAVRYRNPANGAYAFHTIIKRRTRYPTLEPISTLTIKAAFDQQSLLGLAIYEISSQSSFPSGYFEIMFNENGEVRIFPTEQEENDFHLFYWMNEQTPSFLVANPPAAKGEARFSVEFEIDSNKMLLISAFDLKTARSIFAISSDQTHLIRNDSNYERDYLLLCCFSAESKNNTTTSYRPLLKKTSFYYESLIELCRQKRI